MVECLSRGCVVASLSLTGVTVLCPYAKHINPCLVLEIKPGRPVPTYTEKLLTGT